MNTLWLAGAVGALVFAGLFGIAAVLSGAGSAAQVRLRGLRAREQENGGGWSARLQPAWLAFRRVGEAVPRSPKELSKMERRLVAAGLRRPGSVAVFHGLQAVLAALFFILFVASGRLQTRPLLYGPLALLLGAALPDVALNRAVSRRKLAIQLGLPDALDLMVVAIEAGLGLDQALLRISEELRGAHPQLCDELRQYSLEVQAGKSRSEALRNLGLRSNVPDLRALVAVLIQTDRFGTSIADALRVFSDSLRTKRRQRAEEAAAKLPVKLVGPLILFIFPATLVVVVGPALIAIFTELLPKMAGHR